VQTEKTEFRLPRSLEILLGVVVLLELIAPFVTKTYGVDGHLHINMIDQFTRLVSEGVLIPRWVPDGFHGFGATTFYFYPPVTMYLASVFRLLLGLSDPYVLFQMTGLAATIGSFFTARVLLKSIGTSNYQINLGSLLFAFAPFRLADLYGRSSLPAHVSYMFLPLVWYGLIQIAQEKNSIQLRNIVQLGLSSALLALTNVPAVLATCVCIVIAAIATRKQLTLRILIRASLAGLIAAGLCAYHFLSSYSLAPYSHLSNLIVGDPQFILLHLFSASSIPALYYMVPLYAATAILAIGYWQSIRTENKEKTVQVTDVERITFHIGLAIIALTLYLETPYISLPAWRYIPGFNLIQFGWRFYPFFILFASSIVSVARSQDMRRAATNVVWVWSLSALGPIAMIVFSFHIFAHTTRPPEDPLEYRPIYSAPNDTFIDRLPEKNADFVPVIDEMTRVYAPHELDSPAVASLLEGERIITTKSRPYCEDFDVMLHGQREVTFHRFYWPTWHLYENEHQIISHPDTIGRAVATLPEGNYTLRWHLEKTPLELCGLWVSGIIWSMVLISFGIDLHNRFRRQNEHELVTSE
jgi:hypothetical protein